MTKALTILFLMTTLIFWGSQKALASNTEQLIFVYVHGLGGQNKETPFVHNLKELIKNNKLTRIKVKHYSWDSPVVRWRVAPADFISGKKKAKKEARQFAESVLQEYENQKTPYYIIGHSIGTYLIAKSLEEYAKSQQSPLQMLRGIFFLGSSLLRDYTIDSSVLPTGFKITNYYSSFDRIVPLVYSIEAVKAAGEVGFDDIKHFKNLKTTFSHSYKGFGIHRDYSLLAKSIGYIMLLQENIFIKGKPNFEIQTKKIMKEASWFRVAVSWDDIFEFTRIMNGEKQNLRVQQRWPKPTYRIVIENSDGQLYQLAKGDSLHAMLKKLGLYPVK
ncbi:MAG: hypothetical protein ABFS56_08080 [Pseudomonadota bacterium]